ncbi:MAG: hypothetical protein A3F09_05475 [Chlamydiae bacterium RIFCSPHIGHO2_12_FULL_49_11]|nr:MAG: hypothetical protein A3F09_05475 [Chlamydiae bacterium RIFCSPHIGHO2_12_FULL_49_11]
MDCIVLCVASAALRAGSGVNDVKPVVSPPAGQINLMTRPTDLYSLKKLYQVQAEHSYPFERNFFEAMMKLCDHYEKKMKAHNCGPQIFSGFQEVAHREFKIAAARILAAQMTYLLSQPSPALTNQQPPSVPSTGQPQQPPPYADDSDSES